MPTTAATPEDLAALENRLVRAEIKISELYAAMASQSVVDAAQDVRITALEQAKVNPTLGVYVDNPVEAPKYNYHQQFDTWLGAETSLAVLFCASDNGWTNMMGPDWTLKPWADWAKLKAGRNVIVTLPPWPYTDTRGGARHVNPATGQPPTWQDIANGYGDKYYPILAQQLAKHGLMDAMIRFAWEFEGTFTYWHAAPGSGREAAFAAGFRKFVTAMRQAVPANRWKFMLNLNADRVLARSYLDATYPGDAFLDLYTAEGYDSWAPGYPGTTLAKQQAGWEHKRNCLAPIRQFALDHQKPMGFPEWGVMSTRDATGEHGGLDNELFMRGMCEFILDPANKVAFHSYWNTMSAASYNPATSASGHDCRLTPTGRWTAPTLFPKSAAIYKEYFG